MNSLTGLNPKAQHAPVLCCADNHYLVTGITAWLCRSVSTVAAATDCPILIGIVFGHKVKVLWPNFVLDSLINRGPICL